MIPAGKPRYPTLDLTKFISSLVIDNGASLRTSGRDLTVYGDAGIQGTLTASAGETIMFQGNADFTGGVFTQANSTVVMGGAIGQSLASGGNTFYGLVVTNTMAGVTFNDAVIATNLLNGGGTVSALGTVAASKLVNAGGTLAVTGTVAADLLINWGGTATFHSAVASGTFTNTGTLTFDGNLTTRDFICPVSGRTLTFHADSDYTVTASLELYGSAGNLLKLRSSSDGSAWRLHATGFTMATYVDVKDSDANDGLTIRPILSTDSTGNQNWDFGSTASWIGWTGASSTQFTNAANWFPSGSPSAASLCLIDGRYTNAPTISTTVTVARLVVGGQTSAVLTVNAPLTVGQDVDVVNGGLLTHAANTSTELYKLNLTVGGNLIVRGSIDAYGRGYAAQQGPGKGIGDTGKWGSGSYGGRGWGQIPGNTYGSIIAPTNLGSGGRDWSGGGAIRLKVTGDTRIDGFVGVDGATYGVYYGGSGGSIDILTGTMSGSGVVSAKGGEEPSLQWGSGGGGRIAIRLTSGNTFGAVAIRAWGGYAPNYNSNAGGAGTIYLTTASQWPGYGTLIVDNNNKSYPYTTMIGTNVTGTTVGDVLIQNAARLEIESNQTLTAYGSWSNGALFIADTGSTVVLAGPEPATVYGMNAFWNLESTTLGKTLAFQASRTNWVNGSLTLRKVTVGSTSNNVWFYLRLAAGATQDVQRVTVRDSNATNGQTIVGIKSLNLGHNVNWKFTAITGTIIVIR